MVQAVAQAVPMPSNLFCVHGELNAVAKIVAGGKGHWMLLGRTQRPQISPQ